MAERWRVVVTGSLHPSAQALLRAHNCEVESYGMEDLVNEDRMIEALRGRHALVQGGLEVTSARVIEAADTLRVIAVLGVGYASYVDADAAARHAIAVANTPGANAEAVAEATIALMLAARRNIVGLHEQARYGDWSSSAMQDLRGSTLGIVGMGTIGRRVAQIARAGFDMRILYMSRSRKLDVEAALDAQYVSLDEMLEQANVVSLHTIYDPYQPETASLIGARELALMKRDAILVNTARAHLVNPRALLEALTTGQIACAAFDGYYEEPGSKASDDPHGLLRLPGSRFIMTPHSAWNTPQSLERMSLMAVQAALDVLEGRESPYIVNGVQVSA